MPVSIFTLKIRFFDSLVGQAYQKSYFVSRKKSEYIQDTNERSFP